MNKSDNPNPGWEPEFTLDLNSASGQRFQDLVDAFERSTKELGELPPLQLKSGWNTITPQLAEELLRRNRAGANRKAQLSTIAYYAMQMFSKMWPKTGQPILFTKNGILIDGQHRLWAAYLGLVSFDTYVVVDVPDIEKLFAYIDNSKPRNASAALQTAGLNGLSPLISQTIQVSVSYERGDYTCHKKKRSIKMAPIQVLDYLEAHPQLRYAVRLSAGEYKEAREAIGHKEIAAFVIYKIITLHNEEVCEHFMEDLAYAHESTSADDEAVKKLRVYLDKQARSTEPMAKHLVLAYIIKAFNAWFTRSPIKRLIVDADESFPQFAEAEKAQEETE
jgi:hypothetical protein